MKTFSSTQSLGEIVVILPKASEVFKHYKIDYCCGGNRPLIEAIKEQKLNEDEVLKKLNEAFEESKKLGEISKDFRELSPRELIDYIENKHHTYVKRALPELNELTTKIMRVHGANHEVLFKVHRDFSTIKAELEQHLIKEEDILFPLVKDYERSPNSDLLNKIRKVKNELEDEHEAVGNIIKELRIITREYKIPDDVCGTYCMTFDKLQEFEADLFQHIHLENNILFKKLDIDTNNTQ